MSAHRDPRKRSASNKNSHLNPSGVGFATLAALGWATSMLTQRIRDRFTGLGGLSITVPIAALTAATIGIPPAAGHITPTRRAIHVVGITLVVCAGAAAQRRGRRRTESDEQTEREAELLTSP